MQIFNISIADKPLTNIEFACYARLLKIPDLREVFMRDTLPKYPFNVECGIVNFNTSTQPGSHWVCHYRNKNERIYFNSCGQISPVEIQRYLKTSSEFDRGKEVIQRNTDIVKAANTPVCGHLCLFVLKSVKCSTSKYMNSFSPNRIKSLETVIPVGVKRTVLHQNPLHFQP